MLGLAEHHEALRARVEALAREHKVYTAEALMRSAHDAVQIQGARAIGEDSLVGRTFKDAKVSEIVEGANEVQRTLIAEYELGIRTAARTGT